MTAHRLLFLLGGVFGLIGLGALAGAVYAQRSAAAFDAAAVRTTGVVVDFETRRSSGSKSSTTYAPVFEFSDREGGKHRATSATSSSGQEHKIGQRVEVLYLPSAPEQARLDTWAERWLAVTILGSIGGAFALVGIGLAALGARMSREKPAAAADEAADREPDDEPDDDEPEDDEPDDEPDVSR